MPVLEDFKSKWDKVLGNVEINLVKLPISESDVVIDQINKDIQEHFYDQYRKDFDQKRLEMEKKQLPLMSELEKRRYKKWNSLYVNVARGLIPTRDINQGSEIVSAAIQKELHVVENDNKQGGNTKKSDAEILKNAKPKGIIKVINIESHQNHLTK